MRKSTSFSEWFIMIVFIIIMLVLLINISKDSQEDKPVNFQSYFLK